MGGADLDDGAVGLGKDQRADAGKGNLSVMHSRAEILDSQCSRYCVHEAAAARECVI